MNKLMHSPMSRGKAWSCLILALSMIILSGSGSISYASRLGAEPVDYGLPNTGLVNPAGIIWPYGDEYSYEIHLNGPFNPLDSPGKMLFRCTCSADETGGSVVEKYETQRYGLVMTGVATLEFDEHRRVRALNTTHKAEFTVPTPGTPAELLVDVDYKPMDGELYISDVDMEIDAPSEGFFLFTGVDSPGQAALLLSAVDIDGEEPVKVWAFNGGDWLMGPPMLGIFRFMRIAVTPLEKCSSETKRWWRNMRDDYDGWKPGDDIKTVIFEIEQSHFDFYMEGGVAHPDFNRTLSLYPSEGPYAAAYIDDEMRVIRIEQPTGLLGDLAELKILGAGGPWWGKAKAG